MASHPCQSTAQVQHESLLAQEQQQPLFVYDESSHRQQHYADRQRDGVTHQQQRQPQHLRFHPDYQAHDSPARQPYRHPYYQQPHHHPPVPQLYQQPHAQFYQQSHAQFYLHQPPIPPPPPAPWQQNDQQHAPPRPPPAPWQQLRTGPHYPPSNQPSAAQQQQQQSNKQQHQRQHNQSAPQHTKPQRRPAKRKGNKIPENWSDVPAMGDLVANSRFVPMRCPLDAKFAHLHAEPADAWSPQLFLTEQKRRSLAVGLVIDLTNTLKYYDGPTEFQDSSVEYVKLPIEGFNAPPRAQDVARFTAIVDEFTAAHPDAAIAVHCTHGLNRTGYLIAHYLVAKRQCSVRDALAAFALARPPGLIKHMYVEALYKLLGPDETVELPEMPAWAADKYGKRR